jgi:hypothetical protein
MQFYEYCFDNWRGIRWLGFWESMVVLFWQLKRYKMIRILRKYGISRFCCEFPFQQGVISERKCWILKLYFWFLKGEHLTLCYVELVKIAQFSIIKNMVHIHVIFFRLTPFNINMFFIRNDFLRHIMLDMIHDHERKNTWDSNGV